MSSRIKKSKEVSIKVATKRKENLKSGSTSIVPVELEKETDLVSRGVLMLESMDNALIPKNTTKEEVVERVLNWIKDWSEATRDKRRVSGRDNKKFLMPQNYMFQSGNSKSIEDMRAELDYNMISDDEGRAMGDAMLNHLYVFGRKTIDEMVAELKGIDKDLLVMALNDLVKKCWLRVVKEKDEKTGEKIKTLELVTKTDRKRLQRAADKKSKK